MKATVYFETMGCQMNKLDSELLADDLVRQGCRLVERAEQAEVIVLNTCSVRGHAEEKVFSKIGQLRRRHERGEVIVAVVGCMAERLGQKLLDDWPQVDVVCGPGRIHQLAQLIGQVQSGGADRQRALALNDPAQGEALEAWDACRGRREALSPFQAYVRAMRGCNNYCSYCVVPYVRGPEQSRPLAHIVAEARRLAEGGVKEITLLGQAVNAYRDPTNGAERRLAELLQAVHEIPELWRLRFVTNYPGAFDERLLGTMQELPKVCEYLHVCAQSGSDRILGAMHRRYSAGQYLALIDRARALIPRLAVAGDFIVGFPGETEEDFAATCRLARQVRYKNCFIFKYSPRPGTYAAQHLPDDVPEPVKRRRHQELLALQDEISLADNRHFVGRTVEILVEGASKHPHLDARAEADGQARLDDSGTSSSRRRRGVLPEAPPVQLVGRTRGDHIVVFPGGAELIGRLAEVRIKKVSALTLFGEFAAVRDQHGGGPSRRGGADRQRQPETKGPHHGQAS